MVLRTAVVMTALLVSISTLRADDLGGWLDQNVPELVSVYKEFHQAPELSFQEKETAARLAKALTAAGFEVTTGIGGDGVVALLKNGDGPTVMFRTDLDALPVTEETGLEYASKVKTKNDDGTTVGAMHACGHDIHITNLIGLARYAASHRDEWNGTLMLIGQPAEERVDGAVAMLKDGLYTKFPKPQFAVALHVEGDLEAGKVSFRAGYAFANSDSCDITMRGRGGHGSKPDACIDPILQAAQLVVDLQSIVSREVTPFQPAVITVGSIHGGTKHNIISDACKLQLTIRSYTPEVRKQLRDAIERKAKAVAESSRAPEPLVTYDEGTAAVFNDEALTARIVGGFVDHLGKENVVPSERVMGAEDFGEYAIGGVPIFMFRLGSVDAERLKKYAAEGVKAPSLHSSKYFPTPEPTLRTGVRASVIAIRELMPAKKTS
jgi:amidohydrolase